MLVFYRHFRISVLVFYHGSKVYHIGVRLRFQHVGVHLRHTSHIHRLVMLFHGVPGIYARPIVSRPRIRRLVHHRMRIRHRHSSITTSHSVTMSLQWSCAIVRYPKVHGGMLLARSTSWHFFFHRRFISHHAPRVHSNFVNVQSRVRPPVSIVFYPSYSFFIFPLSCGFQFYGHVHGRAGYFLFYRLVRLRLLYNQYCSFRRELFFFYSFRGPVGREWPSPLSRPSGASPPQGPWVRHFSLASILFFHASYFHVYPYSLSCYLCAVT